MNGDRTHTTGTAELGKRTILVVASETVKGTLCDSMRRRSGEPPAKVLVIAPALNSRLRHWLSDEDGARRSAGLRLSACLERLSAAGIQAEGLVGDADPLQAITDALQEFGAHEIVIAAHPQARPHWLTHDLAGRARQRFAQAVVHLDGEPRDDAERVSDSVSRRQRAGSAKSGTVAARGLS
jgi:hypothetical protein